MSDRIISSISIPVSRLDVFARLRAEIRQAMEVALEEELEAALGAAWYKRSKPRSGYRNGSLERDVATEHGATSLRIPRGRLFTEEGSTQEWRSELLPRYQRRTRAVDDAILGLYFAGANTRRIRLGLQSLFRGAHLSKSTVSRVVAQMKVHFEAFRSRDLSDERCVYVFLDGFPLSVRLARRVVKVPVQVALGVHEDGSKVLLSLSIAASESTASWTSVIEDLHHRGLVSPLLVIADGNPGLCRAIRESWPGAAIQRCTKHKLENLKAKAPKHVHAELKRDYDRIVYASNLEAGKSAREAFRKKWTLLSKEVVKSLEEAGDDLLSFYAFPQSQWKSLRTSNPLERLNGEFRRRTKTQGSFRNEDSALVLLYGLIAVGQIRLRSIDGCRDMHLVTQGHLQQVA